MFTALQSRKKHRSHFLSNKKAFSSIAGAIFAVLVIFSLASTVFVWSLNQNTRYNNAVTQKNQMISDQQNENVEATDVTYSVLGNVVSVSPHIKNLGSLSTQLITLWVTDVTKNTTGFTSLNITIKPGDSYTPAPIGVQVGGSPISSDSFTCNFITSRGNSVAGEPPVSTNVIVAEVAQGIGAISLNFNDFAFFNVSQSGSNYVLNAYPNGASGYSVNQPSGQRVGIAFGVSLTNFDQDKRVISLSAGSVLFSIFPTTPQQVRGAPWYIVNVDGNGKISNTYSTVSIGYLQTVRIYFASYNQITPATPFSPTLSGFTGTAPVNLALIGQIGTANFGQNIPFVSIYFNT